MMGIRTSPKPSTTLNCDFGTGQGLRTLAVEVARLEVAAGVEEDRFAAILGTDREADRDFAPGDWMPHAPRSPVTEPLNTCSWVQPDLKPWAMT